MKSLIDQKLDEFYSKESPRFMDKTIWNEVFEIAVSYEKTDVDEYNYQIMRLRDLKNIFDYQYEENVKLGRFQKSISMAKKMILNNESIERIIYLTDLTEKDIIALN